MQADVLSIDRAYLAASLCFVDTAEYIKNNLLSIVFICLQIVLLLYICLFPNLCF